MNNEKIEYQKLRKLYEMYKYKKDLLYKYLNILTNKMSDPKGDLKFVEKIFKEQDEQEEKQSLKSRFNRNIMDAHCSEYLVEHERFSKIFSCKPEIKFPGTEEEFNKFSDNEKSKLESDIYKGLAIISARLANLTNRLYKKIYPDALTYKDTTIRDFLVYASIYNYLVDIDNQILFGFCEEFQTNGSVLLNASIPGYTRFSVHFGNHGNFFSILKNANRIIQARTGSIEFPTKKNSKEIDKNGVYDKFQYNIPTFGVTYNGIINSDHFNYIQNHASVFSDALGLIKNAKSVNSERGIEYAIGIFLYCYCSTCVKTHLNDREIYQIAERAAAGKNILLSLENILKERTKINKNAELNERNPIEEYFFSRDDQQLTEILSILFNNDENEFKSDFIFNLFFKAGDREKLNEKNIIMLLSRIEDEKIRKEIFDEIQYEFGDEKSLKEELKNYISKSNDEKLDIHKQMMETTLDTSKEERDVAENEDKRILDWIENLYK